MNWHAKATPKIESAQSTKLKLKMSRHPVVNLYCSPRRYIGAISEAHIAATPVPMCENDGTIVGHRLSAPFLEQLLLERGVIGRLEYSMQTTEIERGAPALFAVYVAADSKDELDQFYETIMQVLQPFLL